MYEDFAASVAACTSLDAVREAFRVAIAREGYETSTSRAWLPGGDTPTTQSYFRNWPKGWAKLSDEKNFAKRSFVIAEARRRLVPFTWLDAKQQRSLTPSDQEMWNIVHDFGYSNGLVVPVHGPQGYFATVALSSTERDLDFSPQARMKLWMLALVAHERCLAVSRFAPQRPCELSARELECLRWVAAGKTDWEIGVILSISSSTVRFHVDRARLKLGTRTRAQAVARIALFGL